jgi:rhamnose transport system ATP-binding protein
VPTAQATQESIIRAMVGREMSSLFDKEEATIGAPVLECDGLARRGSFSDISFTLHSGEILCLAGLVGAGRTEVARAVFGIDPPDGGQVRVDGRAAQIRSPKNALDLKLAMVPEDRQKQGLVLSQSVGANVTLAILRHIATAGWIQRGREAAIASTIVSRLQLKARGLAQPARELSGGNQQKVVLAKWLVTRPRVLILDEPTRGIDVGAKAEVHRLMSELAAQGLAILMISSELPEVLAMSDNIIVMREGRIAARFNRAEATPERLMIAATGEASVA